MGKSYLVLIKDFKDLADKAKRITAEEAKSTPEQLIEAKLLKEKSGSINGYDYVDLGLPSGLKWATCNVGACSPEQYGDYYAWGELNTRKVYTEEAESCETYGFLVSDISDDPEYDVARVKLGSGWRMPTKAEFKELQDKCKWEWVVLVRKNGYMVTGPNGKSIFLPAAGYRYEEKLHEKGKICNYWSSTPIDEWDDTEAFSLEADVSTCKFLGDNRAAGLSVRPVSELKM